MKSLSVATDSALHDEGRSDTPLRPRFTRELVVVPFEGGIAIDGAHRFYVLRGETWKSALPRLRALIDGSRSLDEIQAALPDIPQEHVRDAVSSLFALSAVEDGADLEPELISNRETLSFFRRYHGTTGANRNGVEAYEKLRTSEVVIVHATAAKEVETLRSLLRDTGVGRVESLSRESLSTWKPSIDNPTGKRLIVSIAFAGEDYEWHADLDDWCAERQIPWLRATIDESRVNADLGPLFRRDENPCYRCFLNVNSASTCSESSFNRHPGDMATHVLTGMLSIEIIYWITDIGPLATGRGFQRYQLPRWTAEHFSWPFVPGCFRCRPPLAGGPKKTNFTCSLELVEIETPVAYEDFVGLQSRPVNSTQMPLPKDSQAAIALICQAKRLEHCRQYKFSGSLPSLERGALRVLSQGVTVPTRTPTANDLAAILLMTAGIRSLGVRQNELRRWAATAGNLGSVELSLAIRHVEGLESGLYFYQPYEHALAHFKQHNGGLEIQDFIRRAILDKLDYLPDVVILLTGAYHRASQKYGAFGYRLIHLDAGAAVSQLLLIARSLNIQSVVATGRSDELIEEQLILEPMLEQPTAVVALYGAEAPRSRNLKCGPAEPQLSLETRPITSTTYSFKGLTPGQLVESLYRESRIRQLESHNAESGALKYHPDFPQDKPLVSLPSPVCDGPSVASILAGRRSVRHYTNDLLSLRQVCTMLRCAQDGDANDWPDEHRAGQQLDFLVFAQRLEGASPAVYAYNENKRGLSRIAVAPSLKEMSELFVQPEFASAPLFVWIVGNLHAACARHGAFGHRLLLLRAGAAGHRLWLGALSVGLSGCLIAGLIPGAGRRRFALDGYERASLLGFAAGHPQYNG